MQDEIKYIRTQIDKWYDALLSREEEEALIEYLKDHKNLPDDLLKDRELILGLEMCADRNDFLPFELQAKIAAALDKEIAMEADPVTENKDSFSLGISLLGRRKWWWAAAGIMIIISGTFITSRMLKDPKLDGLSMNTPSVTTSLFTKLETQKNQNITDKQVSISKTPQNMLSAAVGTSSMNQPAREDVKVKPSSEVGQTKKNSQKLSQNYMSETEDNDYLSSEEEDRLAKSNYRIIRTEEEADQFMSTVLARFDNNIERETGIISKVEREYDSRIIKLSEIENVTNTIQQYHEDAP